MELAQVIEELKNLKADIGEECYLSASLNIDMGWRSEEPVYLNIYPMGIIGTVPSFNVFADTWENLVAAAKAEWQTRCAEFNKKTVREMALAIIRITAELGHCTDAALRGAKFSNNQIKQFSQAATEDANQIASNGPFSIIAADKSNEA